MANPAGPDRGPPFYLPGLSARQNARGNQVVDNDMARTRAEDTRPRQAPRPPSVTAEVSSRGAPPRRTQTDLPSSNVHHSGSRRPDEFKAPALPSLPRDRPPMAASVQSFPTHSFPTQGQQSFRSQQHAPRPQAPSTSRPPSRGAPPVQTPRGRSQSLRQPLSHGYENQEVDLAQASRMRAKTPTPGIRAKTPTPARPAPTTIPFQPGEVYSAEPSTPSPSPPRTPVHDQPHSDLRYHTDPPNSRPLSPSPSVPDDYLPLAESVVERAAVPIQRPASRMAPRDLCAHSDQPDRQHFRRPSSSMSVRGDMQPPKSLVETALETEKAQRAAAEELNQCKSIVTKPRADLQQAEVRALRAEEDAENLSTELKTSNESVESLRKSKEVSIASAKKVVTTLKDKVTQVELDFQATKQTSETPAVLSSEIERLRLALAVMVKSAAGSPPEADDEDQENVKSGAGMMPYHLLLSNFADATRRARSANATAREASDELVAAIKQKGNLRAKLLDIDCQVEKTQATNQLLTQRVRDLEQNLSETMRKWRDDEEASRQKIRSLQDEQYKSLPEREISKAGQIVAEVECRYVKKELVAATKNLESLRGEFDVAQEKFDQAVGLLSTIGVLDGAGEVDHEALSKLEGHEERHEAVLRDMKANLVAAEKEIISKETEIARLQEQATMTNSQRIALEAAGTGRDQEKMTNLEGRVAELQTKLAEAEKKVVEGKKSHDEEELEMAIQLQAMQDRGKEREVSYAANETRLRNSVDAQATSAKKLGAENQTLTVEVAAMEQELAKLRAEPAKPKASSPTASEASQSALKAELRAEKAALAGLVEMRDSELAAADERTIERKEEIEKLVKARETLESDLQEARAHIQEIVDDNSGRSNTRGNGNGPNVEMENSQLKEDVAFMRKLIAEKEADVQQRYEEDDLTASEEKAIEIATSKANELRAKEMDALNRKLRICSERLENSAQSEDRLRKEIKAMRSDPKRAPRGERHSSDLTSPPRSDDVPKTPSSSRSSASTSKKVNAESGRAPKKARFDDEAIANKSRSSKNSTTGASSSIGVANTNVNSKQTADHQDSAFGPDPITTFSSQMDPPEERITAGTSSAASKEKNKRRRINISDDEEHIGAPPTVPPSSNSKSATSKAIKKSTSKSKGPKASASTPLAAPSNSRQTRAASRHPSDASTIITSTPLPVLTQNPSKLRYLKANGKTPSVEEVDELDDDE